jgi:carboxymethylenebutenolidase
MEKLREDDVMSDLERLTKTVAQRPGVRAQHLGVLGFCMGGGLAFACALRFGFAAAVCFYGGSIAKRAGHAAELRCPVLLFFGGADAMIPQPQIAEIRAALAKQSQRFDIVVYPGRRHGFFCDERAAYDVEAAADAWSKTTKFYDELLSA